MNTSPTTRTAPRVFISYGHDSEALRLAVLSLAERLRGDGIDARIDRYTAAPSEGWIRWMKRQIRDADFVLLVCTTAYARRFDGPDESDSGRGSTFETQFAQQLLYDAGGTNEKFIPVTLEGHPAAIPVELRQYTRYALPEEYEALVRRLTGQPEIAIPALGDRRPLPPKNAHTGGTTVALPTGAHETSPPSRRGWALVGAALIVVTGIGVASSRGFVPNDPDPPTTPPDTSWEMSGTIQGLDRETPATIRVTGGCRAPVDPLDGSFVVRITPRCDAVVLKVAVHVPGMAEQRYELPRERLRAEPATLRWEPQGPPGGGTVEPDDGSSGPQLVVPPALPIVRSVDERPGVGTVMTATWPGGPPSGPVLVGEALWFPKARSEDQATGALFVFPDQHGPAVGDALDVVAVTEAELPAIVGRFSPAKTITLERLQAALADPAPVDEMLARRYQREARESLERANQTGSCKLLTHALGRATKAAKLAPSLGGWAADVRGRVTTYRGEWRCS